MLLKQSSKNLNYRCKVYLFSRVFCVGVSGGGSRQMTGCTWAYCKISVVNFLQSWNFFKKSYFERKKTSKFNFGPRQARQYSSLFTFTCSFKHAQFVLLGLFSYELELLGFVLFRVGYMYLYSAQTFQVLSCYGSKMLYYYWL